MAIDICCVLQVWLVGEDGENDFHEYENGDDFKDIKILIILNSKRKGKYCIASLIKWGVMGGGV